MEEESNTTENTAQANPIAPAEVQSPIVKKSKPKVGLLVLVASAVLFLGTGAAAYTKFVLNSPENIWSSALQNTSKGYSELVVLANEEPAKGGKVEGSFTATAPIAADGKVTGAWYEKNADYSANVGIAGIRITADIKAVEDTDTEVTTTYVKLEGLDGASELVEATQPELAPLLGAVNGSWYAIDQTLLGSVLPTDVSDATTLNREEVNTFVTKLGTILDNRLFTEDKSKAVVIINEPIGREEFNGHDSYKYNVIVQKQQFTDFISDLKEALKGTSLDSLLGESTGGTDEENTINVDELIPELDESIANYNAEVWVDMNLKYFRNIRITPIEKDGKSQGHIDFGIDYNGGDTIPFSIGIVTTETDGSSDTMTATLSAAVNKASKALEFGFDLSGSLDSQQIAANGKLTVTPSNEPVQVVKPENAKNIMELLGLVLGGDDSGFEQSALDGLTGSSDFLNAVEL